VTDRARLSTAASAGFIHASMMVINARERISGSKVKKVDSREPVFRSRQKRERGGDRGLRDGVSMLKILNNLLSPAIIESNQKQVSWHMQCSQFVQQPYGSQLIAARAAGQTRKNVR